jgi:hypothetical protein
MLYYVPWHNYKTHKNIYGITSDKRKLDAFNLNVRIVATWKQNIRFVEKQDYKVIQLVSSYTIRLFGSCAARTRKLGNQRSDSA